jgi:hypothetical protein
VPAVLVGEEDRGVCVRVLAWLILGSIRFDDAWINGKDWGVGEQSSRLNELGVD